MSSFKKNNIWEVLCDGCYMATIELPVFSPEGPHIMHLSQRDWGGTHGGEQFCPKCRHLWKCVHVNAELFYSLIDEAETKPISFVPRIEDVEGEK